MLVKSVLVLAILAIVESKNPIREIKPRREAITDAVTEIVSSFFIRTTSVLDFIRATNDDESRLRANDIISTSLTKIESEVAVFLEDIESNKRVTRQKSFNIFFVDSYDSFRKIFKQITPESFSYRGYYLIVLTKRRKQQEDMTRMFEDLWSIYITNVNIIYALNSNISVVFTYFPYSEFYCEKVVPVLLNSFTSGKGFNRSSPHFPSKMSNLHECPISVVTFEVPPFTVFKKNQTDGSLLVWGIDGILLAILSERMNFTLVKVIHNSSMWGYVNEDGTSGGAIRMVMTRKVNFTIGGFANTPVRNMWMSSSFAYHTSNLLWAIGSGRALTPLERFSMPFHLSVWFCVIFTFIVSVVVISIIKCQPEVARNFVFGTNIRYPILNMVNICFGGSMVNLPRRNFARYLMGFFLFYTLVIRNAYTGSLFRFLRMDKMEQHVRGINGNKKATVEMKF